MTPDIERLWSFLPIGYALTVALELPVLLAGLSNRHPVLRRLFAGFWLTACTYPIVVIVLPLAVPEAWGRAGYLAIAEAFAPAAECALFWFAFAGKDSSLAPATAATNLRDFAAIVAANLLSFLLGGWMVESWA